MSVLSHVRLFATPWTVAHKAPLSMGSFGQEYWSKLPFLSPGDLPNPGIKPLLCLLHWQAYSLPLSHLGIPYTHIYVHTYIHVEYTHIYILST